MNRNEYYKSTYGYKAEVIKDLYQDKDFSDLIPKTIFISDMVFYKFLLEDNEVYSKCLTWFKASLNNTGEEEDDTFEELQKLIRERYVPFMKREIPNLEERIEKEFGKGKKVIVRSSGIEDLAESINAGGNRSIPEVEPKDIYGAIMEVVLSYFSPKVLKILHITTIDQMVDPFEFQCPVFIQEMVGSTNWVLDTELYPRIETNTLVSIANKVLQLKEKFGRDIDTEWVLKADNVAVSIVAFSRDPYYGSECVYMLCSLGVGSAVRRTAIVNATHYAWADA